MGIGNIDPQIWAAIIQAGGAGLAGAAGASQQGKATELDAQQQKIATLMALMGDQSSRSGAAMSAMGGPLDLANQRGNFATKREFLFGGPGGSTQWIRPGDAAVNEAMGTMPDLSGAKRFFTDEAMMESERPWWQGMSGLTGGKITPNLGAAGYQGAGGVQAGLDAGAKTDANDYAQQRAAIMQALQGDQAKKEEEKKSGGGFWSKLGKGLLGVAPLIAAPFTGGMSLAAQAALMGGLGAAGAVANGGGLGGAALGGLTGATGGWAGAKKPSPWKAPGIRTPAIGF